MYGDVIPVVDVFLGCFYQFEFLVGVVYQCAELACIRFAHQIAKKLVHLALYIARSILQNVKECFVFAMNIGNEVLGTFRKIENGLQIDNLGACFRDVRE